MSVFLTLLNKILPLYLLILMGFVLGRSFENIKWDAIGVLLLYVISPLVVFSAVSNAYLDLSRLMLPVFFFCLCSLICLLTFYFTGNAKKIDVSNRGILAFAVGSGNTGYFGFPVVIVLFGEEALALAVLATVGFTLYENTVGFFVAARGKYDMRESLKKLSRLPALYAFLAGTLVNFMGIQFSSIWSDFGMSFRGAYVVLGMMLIGLGIAQVKGFQWDLRFLSIAFFAKFIAWPLAVLGLIGVDHYWLHFFDPAIYPVLFLISLVPLPVNSVAVSIALNQDFKKLATTVLLSTFFALIYIPVAQELGRVIIHFSLF